MAPRRKNLGRTLSRQFDDHARCGADAANSRHPGGLASGSRGPVFAKCLGNVFLVLANVGSFSAVSALICNYIRVFQHFFELYNIL